MVPAKDVSRPRARGPFGTAQKGRKGRLGAAAPKNPFDVQQSAIVSYRRVDIVLPLRPPPGLPLRFVGISFTSLVSPQATKLTRSTMPPLPTKSPILRGPQKMQ